MFLAASALHPPSVFSESFRMNHLYVKQKVRAIITRGAARALVTEMKLVMEGPLVEWARSKNEN